MRNEKIAEILDKSPKYLDWVDISFSQSDRITNLLNHMTLELNQLHEELNQFHIKRERQEFTVFKIGYIEGYAAALRDKRGN